jgi:hypothetical protein
LTKFARPHHESPLHHSLTPRQIKSEHNSPHMMPTSIPTSIPADFRLPDYDPNAYSYSPFDSSTPGTQVASRDELSLDDRFPDAFSIPYNQADESLSQQNVDWSGYDFTGYGGYQNMNMNDSGFSASQAMPFASEQFGNLNLNNVTPPRGEAPDVDEFGFSRAEPPTSMSGDGSTGVSSPGDGYLDPYRLSVEGTPHSNILASDNTGSLDIDDYIRQAQEETKRMSAQNPIRQQIQQAQPPLSRTSSAGTSNQSAAPIGAVKGMHPYTIHEAQERAHSAEASSQHQQQQQQQPMTSKPTLAAAMPVTTLAEDPSWSAAPDMSNPTLSLDDAQEDEDWVR